MPPKKNPASSTVENLQNQVNSMSQLLTTLVEKLNQNENINQTAKGRATRSDNKQQQQQQSEQQRSD